MELRHFQTDLANWSLNKEEKIPFTIASGRSPEQMENIRKCFGITLPMAAYNEALILKGQEIISDIFLKADDLKDIILKGDRVGLSVLMGIGGREYTYRRLEIQQKVIMMSVIMRFSSDMVTGKGGR